MVANRSWFSFSVKTASMKTTTCCIPHDNWSFQVNWDCCIYAQKTSGAEGLPKQLLVHVGRISNGCNFGPLQTRQTLSCGTGKSSLQKKTFPGSGELSGAEVVENLEISKAVAHPTSEPCRCLQSPAFSFSIFRKTKYILNIRKNWLDGFAWISWPNSISATEPR